MKIRLNVFQLFSMLIVSLIFSTSFHSIATAQYNSVETPERAAEIDANADTNKFLWFATGCGVSITTFFVGGLLVQSHLNTIDQRNISSDPFIAGKQDEIYSEIDSTYAATLVAVGTSIFGLTHWAPNLFQSSPPSARFVGKTPEWVDAYTTTYTKEKVKIQSNWTDWGLIAGGVAGLMYLLSILD